MNPPSNPDGDFASESAGLARLIADYRAAEIPPVTPEHVRAWAEQFDEADRLLLVREMRRAFELFYFARPRVKQSLARFLRDLFRGERPGKVIPYLRFLDMQTSGESQGSLLEVVDEILQEEFASDLSRCGSAGPHTFVYLDDAVYTGNRLRYDLTSSREGGSPAWLPRSAPEGCRLVIYVLGCHLAGWRYAMRFVREEAARKKMEVLCRAALWIDNRRVPGGRPQFLWPEEPGEDGCTRQYLQALQDRWPPPGAPSPPLFRDPATPRTETLFSSREARRRVERAFLDAGAYLALASARQPHLRPLGYEVLETLGFGTLFLTYRNIANNCPLALWWRQPGVWYPLFPRKVRE